jgi:hypothetical protein
LKAAGPSFFPLPPAADFDTQDIFSRVRELKRIPPRPEWLRIVCERIFVEAIPVQYQGLWQVLDKFWSRCHRRRRHVFFGVLPMLLAVRSKRPPIVLCGTSILHWAPAKTAHRIFLACRPRRPRSSARNTRPSRTAMMIWEGGEASSPSFKGNIRNEILPFDTGANRNLPPKRARPGFKFGQPSRRCQVRFRLRDSPKARQEAVEILHAKYRA